MFAFTSTKHILLSYTMRIRSVAIFLVNSSDLNWKYNTTFLSLPERAKWLQPRQGPQGKALGRQQDPVFLSLEMYISKLKCIATS